MSGFNAVTTRSSCAGEQHRAEDLQEALVLRAGDDVLPAVGLEQAPRELRASRPSPSLRGVGRHEVVGIGGRLHLQEAVDRAHERRSGPSRPASRCAAVIFASSRCHSISSSTACCDSSFMWNMNTSFQSAGQLRVAVDALAVVVQREELDVAGEREHGPRALREHGVGDVVGGAAGTGSPSACPAAIIASRRRKSSWCLSSSSVKRTSASTTTWSPSAWPRVTSMHLRADVALDHAEHVHVGAALDLADEALLGGRGEREALHARQAVGHELAFATSNRRPRITSLSMSQRTRFEASMHWA